MKILFYGRLADAVGAEMDIESPGGCSVAELRERLVARHPEIEHVLRSRRARACVGDSAVNDDYRLAADDTLEFLPPVSGG